MTPSADRTELYRHLVEKVPSSLLVYDDQMRIELVAGQAVERGPHDAADVEGRLLVEVLPDRQIPALVPLYRSALEGETRTVRYRSSEDGKDYSLNLRPVHEPDGSIKRAVAVSMQEESRVSGERAGWSLFRRLFEDVTVGFAIAGMDGRIIEANPGWAKITGRDADEARGTAIEDIAHSDMRDSVSIAVEAISQGAAPPVEVELTVLRSDGAEVSCLLSLSGGHSTSGGPTSILAQLQDISGRRLQEQRLRHMAEHDPLTELLNRRAFEHRLEGRLRGGRAGDNESALLLADVDDLKPINDNFGHLAGDDTLVRVAEALRAAVRNGDPIGRIGGDEFAVLAGTDDIDALNALAARITAEVTRRTADAGMPASISIGIAILAPSVSDRELWRRADRAMYEVKGHGEGVAIWSPALDRIPRPTSAAQEPPGRTQQEVGPGDEERNS